MTRLALLNIPEWTPRKLGNLALWYDATHIAGLSDGDAVTVWKDLANAGEPFYDPFTATLREGWINVQGTLAITGGTKGYFSSNTDGDLAVRETGLADGVVSAVINGDLNTTGLNYSIPVVVTRYADSNNFLEVALYSGGVQLFKKDGGSFSSLALAAQTSSDNTDYTFRIENSGNTVKVYIDGTLKITHTLTAGDTKYAAYTKHGCRLAMSGTPSYTGTWDNFIACKLTDAFQTTAAAKPTYKVNIRNGKPVVRFNGSQYLITAANSVLRNATGATALIVLQTTAPGTQANSLFIANNSAPARLTMLRERTGAGVLEIGGRRLDADSYAAVNGASFTAGVWSVDTGILDYANSNAYLYTNGGLVAQTTSFQTDGNTSDTDSAGTAIGATVTGATAMNGDIAEILVSSAALSDASRRRLENYVGKKYGTTITW